MLLTARQVLQERYEVVRSIKSGGMGAVYEAIDLKLASTPCAIKEMLSSAMQGKDNLYVMRSFESEMRALAKLEHPNIPRVRDYFEIEQRRYIVLDLVQGTGLDDELQEHLRLTSRAMDPAVAALDMVSVLDTLVYLHSCTPPIVHRDIKSANLIRDSRTGKIKLVDFGIARSVETQCVQTQVGTPGFCAPEQMAGRAEVRSDVYSVGATLFNLCTGQLPPAFSFEPLEPDLPEYPGLTAIIKRATQVKPQDRYASAEQMALALRKWLRNEASAKIPADRLPANVRHTIHPLASPPAAPNSSSRSMLIAIAVTLATALLLFLSEPGSQPKSTPTARPTPSPLAVVADPVEVKPVAVPPVTRPPSPKPKVIKPAPPVRPTPVRHILPLPLAHPVPVDDHPVPGSIGGAGYPQRQAEPVDLRYRHAPPPPPESPTPTPTRPQSSAFPTLPPTVAAYHLTQAGPNWEYRSPDCRIRIINCAGQTVPQILRQRNLELRDCNLTRQPNGELLASKRIRRAGSPGPVAFYLKPGLYFQILPDDPRGFYFAAASPVIHAVHY